MGAQFNETSFEGSLSKTGLRDAFKTRQDELRSEYGNGAYQGHLGIKSGLTIHPNTIEIKNTEDLYDENINPILELNDKWGPAEAIKVRVKSTGEEFWYVAGWCSS